MEICTFFFEFDKEYRETQSCLKNIFWKISYPLLSLVIHLKKTKKLNLRIKRFDVNSSFNLLFILINNRKGWYVHTQPCWLSNTHIGVTCKMKWSYKTESIAVLWKHIYIKVMRITFLRLNRHEINSCNLNKEEIKYCT